MAQIPRSWASTAEVCAAAGIADATAMTWAQKGVLPAYKTASLGRHGRQARWPLHAPEQAAWVADLLRQGHTFEEIRVALAQGAFSPTKGEDPPASEGL